MQFDPGQSPGNEADFEINSMMFFNKTVPFALFIMLVVVGIFLFLEKRTVLGKYAISMGGNENATRLSGISVPRMRLVFYFLTGATAAFSVCGRYRASARVIPISAPAWSLP